MLRSAPGNSRAALPPLLAALLLGCSKPCVGGYTPPAKYLIVSNARNGTIGYARMGRTGACGEVKTLIDRQLVHPQGLAVDQKRQLLLVADSELRKVVSYGLTVRDDGSLAVDEQTPVAEDVETRWVSVDGPGNVYITDEEHGRILRVTARQVLDGDTTANPVYLDGGGAIAAPGGLATDNFHLYWTNKMGGAAAGTLMKALGVAPMNASAMPAPKAMVLAKNAPKAYGVCMALDNVFFTDQEKNVYAVRASGGDVVTVSSQLQSPRGCAWDGESTVYVADRSADAVFALPAPMLSLAEVVATKACEFEGAFGVAVYSSAVGWRRFAAAAAPWRLLAVLLASAAAAASPAP